MNLKKFFKVFKLKKEESVLRARIIRADGTVEDLGVIARGKAIKNFTEVKHG
jgi:hypothetical protein